MDMPKPTDHHLKLKKLAGQWQGEETMYPSDWDPKGGKATGRMNSRHGLDGFALISDYEQERNGATTYTGHSVFTYNPKESVYIVHWFDSMGSPPEVFRGTFNGEVLTIAHGGPGMHARLTYDLSQEKRLKMRMEMSKDGKEWKALFDGEYARK
jgi:Protein of unknown function (DUF1579)